MALTVYRGDDVRLNGAVTDQDGVAVNITGWTIVFSAAPELGDTPTFTVSATIISATAGTFYVDLTPTHTLNVRTLVYDVQATTAAGKIYTLEVGEISFVQEVTK